MIRRSRAREGPRFYTVGQPIVSSVVARKRSARKKAKVSPPTVGDAGAPPSESGSIGNAPDSAGSPEATPEPASSEVSTPAKEPSGSDVTAAPGTTPEVPATAPPTRPKRRVAAPVPESFDELAEKVARAQPRRGSMLQPPPAWQPDEVTLGFAMVSDEAGGVRELPEPTLLATILVAVEADRRGLLHRLSGRGEEEIEGIANLFWPLVVLPGRSEPQVAIFDGTGVWRRAFRYTLLPNLDQLPAMLEGNLPPAEYLDRMRKVLPDLAHDPGAEVLNVEGFLPIDPPLLFDVLSQSDFRSDPQSPHAGFLPARHDMGWYHETVAQMYRWLDRFDADIEKLKGVRERIHGILEETERRFDVEYGRLEAESRERVREATAQADAEITELENNHRARIQQHVARIRQAQAVIARAETSAATADTLSFRATHRRTQEEAHALRRNQAEAQVRKANREGAESRKEIERIHAQERMDLEHAIGKVTQIEQRFARALADWELFRDEFSATGTDLLQAMDGQVAARSAQKNLLAGYFLPVASLSSVRVVWFPLWTATLRGPAGIRQLVFPPMRVRAEKRLGGALKQLFGGVVLPVEPRTAQFDKVLRTTMEDALRKDTWLSAATQELTRAADVLVDPDVLDRLQIGLRSLGREGWITPRQEESFLAAYVERSRRRAGEAPGSRAPVPKGALSEPYKPPEPSNRTADEGPPGSTAADSRPP
jgi:hypothetical protein